MTTNYMVLDGDYNARLSEDAFFDVPHMSRRTFPQLFCN